MDYICYDCGNVQETFIECDECGCDVMFCEDYNGKEDEAHERADRDREER